ncbi:DUF6443 domain-containing protein [Hymenobacter sp. UV11]|uniref:DUF6443 domain-containing protein n=1 Tax=Hymenobacter sp. UV11 TaxID=1849735 RepID=UPI0014150AE6|nr:DUF6443 domain-containing protein [Hymenobacter sp. UV11]
MKTSISYLLLLSYLWLGGVLACQAQVTVTASGPTVLAPGGTVTLSGPGGYSSYRWTRNNADVVGTQPTLPVTTPGYYRLQVVNGGTATVSDAVRVTVRQGAGSPDQNYTQEDVVLSEGIVVESNIDLAQTKRKRTITYADGLLRPTQKIEVKASPGNNDVIQFYDYTATGQQPRQYLPYTSGADGLFKSNALANQQAFYSNSGPGKVARETNGLTYSESVFEDTPSGGVIEQGAPGSSGQIAKDGNSNSTFQGHTKRTLTRAVGGGEVAIWTYSSSPDGVIGTASISFSSPNSLTVTLKTDEDGKRNWKYTNMFGQVVAEEVLASSGAWITTAYAYDQAGRTVMIMSPEGVKRVANTGEPITSDFISRWAHLFKYDQRGRLICQKVPGRAWEYLVYDRWDRLVATQNGNQYKQGKWKFSKYDELNRVIATGLISNSRTREQLTADIENAISTGSIGRYEVKLDNISASLRLGYSLNKTWPANTTGSDLLVINYFDSYEFLNTYFPSLRYTQESLADLMSPSQPSIFTTSLPTISQTRILGSNSWLVAATYYDDKSRVIQTCKSNQLGGFDRVTAEYDFSGKILKTYTAHNVVNGSPTHTVRYRYTYYENNSAKDLFAWFNKKDGTIELLLSKKEYNELGQLVDNKLGINLGTGNYLQSVDNRYTLKGQLSHINNRDLLNGVDSNDDTDAEPDLFGLELKYDSDLQVNATTACYNGNITESMWKSKRDNKLRSYAYRYDGANRLTDAKYAAWGAGWIDEKDDISANGSTGGIGRFTVSDIQYDLNGNIQQMNRVGRRNTPSPNQFVYGPIDQLRYNYGSAGGNQLRSVADQAGYSTATNDFEDVINTGDEYVYDDNGNLITDLNKGLNVTYNEIDLPNSIGVGRFQTISFTYSATGEKLSYSVNQNGAVTTETYVNGFVYTTAVGPSLSVPTPVGRALYGTTPDNTTPHWIQEYHIRDHLGNLRIAFRDEGQAPVNNRIATMELANASKEEQDFDNLTSTRELDPAHARTGDYATRLNAGQNQRMFGPSSSVQLHAGDSLHFEVYGRYDVAKKVGVWPILIPLAANTSTPTPTAEGGRSAAKGVFSKLVAGIALAWTVLPHVVQHQVAVPRASIKYDFYDKDSTLIASEVKYLERDAANNWQQLELGFKARQEGYVVVSVQNATKQDVWFDDAALRTTTTELIVQENHYDPWGQNLIDIEVAGAPDCKQQYGSQGRIDGAGLEWIDHGARYYDSQLGRWHVPDPANQFSSPYAGMSNNPVMYTDPDGQFVFIPILIGAAIGAYMGHQIGQAAGANGWGMAGYIVGGAVIGGLSGGLANGVATSGAAFANTMGIFAGSFTNSVMMNMLSGGRTGVTIGFGAASYNFNQEEWGYLGKDGNSTMDNIGYGLGAISNISDGLAGLHPGKVQLNTEHSDLIGHSAITEVGESNPNNSIISVGPTEPGKVIFNPFAFKKGDSNWPNHTLDKLVWKSTVSGVNKNTLYSFKSLLDRGVNYNLYASSCVNNTARALTLSGIPAIGIHPFILGAEMYLRGLGVRPTLFSYHLYTNN